MYKNAAREKKPRNTVRKRGKRGRALLNGADKRHGRHTNGIASSQATLQADMRQRGGTRTGAAPPPFTIKKFCYILKRMGIPPPL